MSLLAHRDFAGHLKNSEEILRDLMRCHESSMSPNRRVSILRELGEILNEAGHRNEAISWFQKEFIVLLENVGLDNPMIKISCRRLGLCYARMGLYNEAMLHFEWMIERLNLEDPQSIHNRQEYIYEVNDWMNEVDEMRFAGLEMPIHESEDSMADDTTTEDSSEDGSITLDNPSEGAQLGYPTAAGSDLT
jgi:hypothetical protein